MQSFLKILLFSALVSLLVPGQLFKMLSFNIVVEVSTAIYLWILYKELSSRGAMRAERRGNLKNKGVIPTPIFLAFSVFIVVSLLAVIFSVDPAESFWGVPAGRSLAGGFFAYFHYFLFFALIVSVFKKKEDYLNLFKFFIAVAFLINIYGLYEKLIKQEIRIDSVMGNPIYLGTFSIFVLFLSIYLFLISEKRFSKILYSISAIFALAAMFYSESRGPFLGLVASLAIATPFLLFWATRKIKNKKILAFAGIAILLAVIAGVYFASDSRLINRFKNLPNDKTISHRLKIWSIAVSTIKEKPILGWGQENFDLAFNKHFDPEFLSDQGAEPWFDRAHNNILDVGTTTGLLGVAAYLSIWLAAFWAIYNFYKNENIKEVATFSLILIAYFISNLTFFDSFVIFIPFVLVLGFLNNFGIRQFKEANSNETANKKIEIKIPDYAAKSLIIFAVVLVFVNIQLIRSSYYYYISKTGNVTIDSVVYVYDKLSSMKPTVFREEGIYFFARFLHRSNIDNQNFNKYFKDVISKLNEINAKQPLETKPLYYMTELYLKDYEVNDNKGALDDAKNVIDKTLKLSPNRQDLYVALAQIEMQKGNFGEAVNYITKVKELNPTFSRPYFFMSVLRLLNNQPEEAEKELEIARKLGITFFNADTANLFYLANYFIFEKKDYDWATYLLNGIIGADDKNIDTHKKLATLYAEMGNKEKAKTQAQEVITLDYNLTEEAKKFIKELGFEDY